MAAADDPQGYYGALGLATAATQLQIKRAYRQWAKKYHPDVTGNADAHDFLRVREAYETLGDRKRRARYDAIAHAGFPHESQRDAWPQDHAARPPEAMRCRACGAISAQPRYCVFSRVIGLLITWRNDHPQGIFCPHCAAGKSLRESVTCWLFGWWSVVGVFVTPVALWRNFRLGQKPADINVRVLMSQALYFHGAGSDVLARSCLAQAARFADADDARTIALLRSTMGEDDGRKIRDAWSVFRCPTSLVHALPIVLLCTAIGVYGLDRHWFVVPAPTPAPVASNDVRYVSVAWATVWAIEDGQYRKAVALPQFTTVEVLGPSTRPNFVTARLPDGRSATIKATDLAAGDGASAREAWCRQKTEADPANNEILWKYLSGENRVDLVNAGSDDAVAKFRDASGAAIVSLYVSGHSEATVDDFPSGTYRLEFATGQDWSRHCGLFLQHMQARRFPTFDTITTDMKYTITTAPDGDASTQPIDQTAFGLN
jgi:hypothetical protein